MSSLLRLHCLQASDAEAAEAQQHAILEEEYEEVIVAGSALTAPGHRHNLDLARTSMEVGGRGCGCGGCRGARLCCYAVRLCCHGADAATGRLPDCPMC
jgi:hypothetical protein